MKKFYDLRACLAQITDNSVISLDLELIITDGVY